MIGTLEDISSLPPKKLVRRLEELADAALPCLGVNVFDGNPHDGLTVGLWVDSGGRRDIHDLVRVVETEPGGWAIVAWATITPAARRRYWTLLLRVDFERPVGCAFDVRFVVPPEADAPMRRALPLLAAADRFAVGLSALPDGASPTLLVAAPASGDAVLSVLS